VLFDLGLVSTKEPFQCLRNQGMILGENSEKMSKSRGNVVNPDDVVAAHGADALRMFLMFLGPLDRDKPWSTKGIEGLHRFLDRVWRLYVDDDDQLVGSIQDVEPTEASLKILHRCIADVTDRTEKLLFNTAISAMMVFVNEMNQQEVRPRAVMAPFAVLLSPYAPHLAEELWQRLGHQDDLTAATWPELDEQYLVEDTITYVVQINGKVRDQLEVPAGAGEDEVRAAALASEKVQKWLDGKEIRKVIFVPEKLLGLVVG
jgi:leucyl-tRNA synthetase